MLNVSGTTRVLVATAPVDLRGSFNRLHGWAVAQLKEDPMPSHLFVFTNRWRKISEERTSQLDWVAPKIIKRVIIRPRYVKAERFALAPLPPQPIEQGMVGPGLLAQILVSKFEYHLPLYRQEKMFRGPRLGEFWLRTTGTSRRMLPFPGIEGLVSRRFDMSRQSEHGVEGGHRGRTGG